MIIAYTYENLNDKLFRNVTIKVISNKCKVSNKVIK